MGYIYCITNLINSKRYIGKTIKNVQERFQEHCRDSKKERCEKRPLYDAMNKYGIENFIVEQLEEVENNTLLSDREIYWINELKTYGSNGYNATKGGDGKILYNHNEIIELARLGYTIKQITLKLKCNNSTVEKVLRANGVKFRKRNTKIIVQYDLAGNYIQLFWGSSEVQNWLIKNGLTNSKRACTSVNKCCIGKLQQAFGYIWKYLPEPFN